MDEIVKLENKIQNALIANRVPDGVLAWAHDVLCNSHHSGNGTRIERLRAIVRAIEKEDASV